MHKIECMQSYFKDLSLFYSKLNSNDWCNEPKTVIVVLLSVLAARAFVVTLVERERNDQFVNMCKKKIMTEKRRALRTLFTLAERKVWPQAHTHRLEEIVSRNTSQNVCNDFDVALRALVECIQTNNYIRIALIFSCCFFLSLSLSLSCSLGFFRLNTQSVVMFFVWFWASSTRMNYLRHLMCAVYVSWILR